MTRTTKQVCQKGVDAPTAFATHSFFPKGNAAVQPSDIEKIDVQFAIVTSKWHGMAIAAAKPATHRRQTNTLSLWFGQSETIVRNSNGIAYVVAGRLGRVSGQNSKKLWDKTHWLASGSTLAVFALLFAEVLL